MGAVPVLLLRVLARVLGGVVERKGHVHHLRHQDYKATCSPLPVVKRTTATCSQEIYSYL